MLRGIEGGQAMLALLLCLAAMTGHGTAQQSASAANEQDADGGNTAHATWRMEATAHVASLAIRNMYCKLEPERLCESLPLSKLRPLQRWATHDAAWPRLLASLSNYELGRRFWQQQDYQKSLEVVEWSIAYKLFPYEDPELQSQWQHNLMGTSSTFKRPKLELADGLILMANCMYEIGRRQSSVEHLYLSLEAIHLSAALMHNSMDLVQEVLSHLELLSQHVALALTQALTRIKSSKLMELMVVYGAQCTSCVERRDFVEALLVRLSLPVRYEAGSGGSSAAQLEVTHPTFVHDAYVRQPGEEQEQFSRRLMQQLVGMVRLGLLSDLNVPCSKWSDEQDCEVHMPGWMHSANKTVSGSGTGAQGAASGSNVSSPATPASSAGSRGAVTVAPPEPMLPPDPGALIEALYSGNVQQDLRRLQWTLELLAGQYAAAAAAQAAAHAPTPQGATAWAALATSWGDEQEGQDHADIGQLEWQTVPPFPPPPALMPGPLAKALGLMPPLPFKPPRPTANRPPSYRKLYDQSLRTPAAQPEPQQKAGQRQPPSASAASFFPSAKGAARPPQEAPLILGASAVDAAAAASYQQQQREGSCCDAQRGDSSCCNSADAGGLGIASGPGVGTSGGSFSFAPWLHTRGVWATVQESPMRPAASVQVLPEQLMRKAAEAVRSSRNDPVVMLLLSGLSATAMLSYTVIKNRRRMGRLLSCTSGLLGRLSVGCAAPTTSASPTLGLPQRSIARSVPGLANAALMGGGVSSASPGPPAAASAGAGGAEPQRRKAAAAALKDALAVFNPAAPNPAGRATAATAGSTGLAKLHAALAAAEASGVQDGALLARAAAALAAEQRRRGVNLGGSTGVAAGTGSLGGVTAVNHNSSSPPTDQGFARQRSRGRTATNGGGGSSAAAAPATQASSVKQSSAGYSAGSPALGAPSSSCTANKARLQQEQQQQRTDNCPAADHVELGPSFVLGPLVSSLTAWLHKLPLLGAKSGGSAGGSADSSSASSVITATAVAPSPASPGPNTTNNRTKHTPKGSRAGAGQAAAPHPATPNPTHSNSPHSAAAASSMAASSRPIGPCLIAGDLSPELKAKVAPARLSAAGHSDNMEHSGGPSSPQSTSTGSSSFAERERISRSSTGRDFPPASSAAASSSAPAPSYGDEDYVWETLPPELTDEGWQEGSKKKRGAFSQAVYAKYRQPEPGSPAPDAASSKGPTAPATASAAAAVGSAAAPHASTPSLPPLSPALPNSFAPSSQAKHMTLAVPSTNGPDAAASNPDGVSPSGANVTAASAGAAPTSKPHIPNAASATSATAALSSAASSFYPTVAAPASRASPTIMVTAVVAAPSFTGAAAAAPTTGSSAAKAPANGAKAAKPQTLPLQQAPQQPGADVIILTRAKPVKTKLGQASKASGNGGGSSAPAASPGASTSAKAGPVTGAAWQQQQGGGGKAGGNSAPGASPAPSPPSSSSSRHHPASRSQLAPSPALSPSKAAKSGVAVGGSFLAAVSGAGASHKAQASAEQLSSMYRFPPPPPPPPPRTPPAQSSTPAAASSCSPAASPLSSSTPCKPPPRSTASPSISIAGTEPGEPNPFAQHSAAMLAAAANAALGAEAPGSSASQPGSSSKAAQPPAFAERPHPARGQSLSAKAFGAGIPANPFKPAGADVLGKGRPLGNGTLGLQLGSFRSADYDSLSLLDGHHTLSHDHDLMATSGETGDSHAQPHGHTHPLDSPSLQQSQETQFTKFKGLSAGGSLLDALPGGAFGPGLGADGATSASAAAPLPSLLFASSSVWSSSAVQATDGGSSWLAHSSSVPLASGVTADTRTSTSSSMGSVGGSCAAPGPRPDLAAAVAACSSGWLPLGGGGGAAAAAGGLWGASPAPLFSGAVAGTWGAPLGGMSLGSPTPGGAPSLSHGLPQIPSESDLVGLDLAFVSEPDTLLGTSPELKCAEAPEWAHQIMSVVE